MAAGEANVKTTGAPEISKIWSEFKQSLAKELRDKLILHYAPLVKYVAGRVSVGLPQNVDQADLISYGMFGLIDAISRFNPELGIKFETYAIPRIKGAIIDELRAMDWVPRSVRQRARSLEKAYVELENNLRRVPTDAEVAEALGISLEEHQELLSQLSYTSVLALDELWGTNSQDDRLSLIDSIEDESSPDPASLFEFEEMKVLLGESIGRLPEREKEVITLYYYQGLTLREIGDILGVSESRVSQLHTKAILRLKTRMRAAQSI